MIITEYLNGNCSVTISDDGTKERKWDGNPYVDFPESIDFCITKKCDKMCYFCHESATIDGEHAKLQHIFHILRGLPAGVEIAIGGGDPLSYPFLDRILWRMKERGLICNLTVNAAHIDRHYYEIKIFRYAQLIKGLGISYVDGYMEDIELITNDNTIVHFIAGIHHPNTVVKFLRRPRKILILGYKKFGRGEECDEKKIEHNLAAWRYWIGTICRKASVACFDNLAIEQLDLRRILLEDTWNRFYMGDDGQFTMYVDAVKMEYAISSISKRKPLDGMNVRQAFNLEK